eukprot:gene12999-13128_t
MKSTAGATGGEVGSTLAAALASEETSAGAGSAAAVRRTPGRRGTAGARVLSTLPRPPPVQQLDDHHHHQQQQQQQTPPVTMMAGHIPRRHLLPEVDSHISKAGRPAMAMSGQPVVVPPVYYVKVAELDDADFQSFVEAAETKMDNEFTANEFQDMMTGMMKYAVLKGNRRPGRRWGLGVSLSAVGGLAIGAGLRLLPVACGAGIMAAAAPTGAVLGSLVILADSSKQSRRNRRRAARHLYSTTAIPAASEALESESEGQGEGALGSAAPGEEVNPTGHPTGDEAAGTPLEPQLHAPIVTSASSRSEELVNAVVVAAGPNQCSAESKAEGEVDAERAADVPAAGPPVGVAKEPAGPRDSADDVHWAAANDQLVSHGKKGGEADAQLVEPASLEPLAVAAVPSPEPETTIDLLKSLDAATARLPPVVPKEKPKGAKKLKKGISKSFKKLGKALSVGSSDAVATPRAAEAGADDEVSSPKAPGFLRRSFSEWRRSSISSLPDSASDLVEPSEGSATMRKMRDMIRRSFTLSTPRGSIDGSSSTKGSNRVRAF